MYKSQNLWQNLDLKVGGATYTQVKIFFQPPKYSVSDVPETITNVAIPSLSHHSLSDYRSLLALHSIRLIQWSQLRISGHVDATTFIPRRTASGLDWVTSVTHRNHAGDGSGPCTQFLQSLHDRPMLSLSLVKLASSSQVLKNHSRLICGSVILDHIRTRFLGGGATYTWVYMAKCNCKWMCKCSQDVSWHKVTSLRSEVVILFANMYEYTHTHNTHIESIAWCGLFCVQVLKWSSKELKNECWKVETAWKSSSHWWQSMYIFIFLLFIRISIRQVTVSKMCLSSMTCTCIVWQWQWGLFHTCG